MPWATLRKLIFFCCEESDEIQDLYDESSHLIPAESSPVTCSNVVLLDHQQLQERLGLIVRTKEGKMVNVASQVPFNLHNKVLPTKRSYGSISRSASGSMDQYSRDQDYQTDYGYLNHGIARQRNFHASVYDDGNRSRSASPFPGLSVGPSSHTRCVSQALDHPMPTPILNVRLVGYTDVMNKTRGRARERQPPPADMPDPTHGTSRVGDERVAPAGVAEASCEALIADTTFKLRDVGSITLNWND